MKKFWRIVGIGGACVAIAIYAYLKILDYRILHMDDQISALAASDLSCSTSSDCTFVEFQFEYTCDRIPNQERHWWATSTKNPHLSEINDMLKLRRKLMHARGAALCNSIRVIANPSCVSGRCQ